MIFDVLFSLATVYINMLVFLLKNLDPLFTFTHIDDAIVFLFSPLNYLKGIIDIDTFLVCLVVVSNFYAAFYSIKFALWAFRFVPFFGKHIRLWNE